MAISFGGLATGLDSKQIIEGLLSLERVPINRLQQSKARFQAQIDALGALGPKVSGLEDAARALRTASGFRLFSASSTDEKIVTAAATSSASAGAYSIEITDLAAAEIEASNGYANADVLSAGDGTLQVTVGGVATQITINSSNHTLQGIARAINESSAKATATVINDGGASPWRLVVTADESGSANTVQINASGLTGGDQSLSFTEKRAAASAAITINGLAITSSSNVVTNAVPGLTFTLKGKTTPGAPETVSVTTDTGAIAGKIRSFVDAYNGVLSQISRTGSRDSTSGSTGVLFGDFTANGIRRKLQALASSTVSTDDETYRSLSSIGIKSLKDGTLSVDGAALTKALTDDPDAVLALFLDGDGGIASEFTDYAHALGAADGGLASRKTGIQTSVRGIDRRIASLESRLVKVEKDFTARFASLETFASRFQGLGTLLQSKLS